MKPISKKRCHRLWKHRNLPVMDSGVKRILIRAPNWVGDAVLCTPAVRTIRKNFPNARITVMAKPWVAPVFVHNPDADEIHCYESEGGHRGLLGRLRLIRELRKKRFNLAVLFQNAFEAALLVFLAGVKMRLGYDTDCRRVLLTHHVGMDRSGRAGHQVAYYLAMLERASFRSWGKELTLNVSEHERAWADSILNENRIAREGLLVGIHPGAAYGPSKRWSPVRYAALCDQIRADWGAQTIIFGGPGEKAVGRRISSLMNGRCLDLCGKTTLREAIALIEKCRLFITNDSGLMHVAAALNIPLVAIFGSTDPVATGPTNQRSRVVRVPLPCSPCFKRECPEEHRCMEEVSVDQVYGAVNSLLKNGRP